MVLNDDKLAGALDICIGRVRLFRLFVQALLCFGAVWLFTPPFFSVRADVLDI